MPYVTIPARDSSDNRATFKAYVAMPDTVESAPVVIMIQEIFGINQEMRGKCDDMAAQGYIALCPDLFWRIEPDIELVDSVPEQLERAFELFGLFDAYMGVRDLDTTLNFARTMDGANGKVGCVGYCLGGKLAYMMACDTDVDACVGYYGVAIETMLGRGNAIKAPLLLHIAEEDEFVDKNAQAKIKQALAGHDHVTTHSYAGVNHAFARGDGMHYDEAAASLANERTRAFLQTHLKD